MAKLQKNRKIWTRLDNFLSLNWTKLDFFIAQKKSNFAEYENINNLRKATIRYKDLIVSSSRREELGSQDETSNDILTF